MSDNTAVRIASVQTKDKYTLQLKWQNGRRLSVDLAEPVHRLNGLRSLRDLATFACAAGARVVTAWCGPAISIWGRPDCGSSLSNRTDTRMRLSSSGGGGVMA